MTDIDVEKEELKEEVKALRKLIANDEIYNKLRRKIGSLIILVGWNVLFFTIILMLTDFVKLHADAVSEVDYIMLAFGTLVIVIYASIRFVFDFTSILKPELEAFGKWVRKSIIKARNNVMDEIEQDYKDRKKE